MMDKVSNPNGSELLAFQELEVVPKLQQNSKL
jgi:hypothetical protein